MMYSAEDLFSDMYMPEIRYQRYAADAEKKGMKCFPAKR
jgi:hypothetical protein